MAMTPSRAFALAATAAAALGLGAVACTDNGPGTASGEFDDEQLEAFVVAEAAVFEIQEDYSARLENAEADQDPAVVQAEAQMEMQTAIEDAGLSIREYNQIARAAERDPELGQQLRELAE